MPFWRFGIFVEGTAGALIIFSGAAGVLQARAKLRVTNLASFCFWGLDDSLDSIYSFAVALSSQLSVDLAKKIIPVDGRYRQI